MKRVLPLFVLIGAFASSPSSAAPTSIADALPDIVEKVLPGVVNISSTTVLTYQAYGMDQFLRFWGIPQERKQTSLGSGFLMDKEGYLLTNNHVVDRATEVMVTLFDKRQYKARLVGKDPKTDLALLQIRTTDKSVPPNLSPVPLADSDATRIAESVFAVGNPFGLSHTVTRGIISAKNRTIGQGPFDNFIQTDASINPGNSGGPLFNLKGEVLGINTMIFSNSQQSAGVGFAIPANEAKRLVPDLKKFGRVLRPWLGVLGERMNEALKAYYNLPSEKGVLIYNLVESAPADEAGIQEGDIVIAIDDQVTLEPYDLERYLSHKKPKESVTLKVLRGRKSVSIRVQLGELPARVENANRAII